MDADFLLIHRIKNKDEAAGETFVRKYYSSIFRYCLLHLRDYHQAEDLTQETFMRFFENMERYRNYGKALNYLYVIAGNACKDYYRKEKRRSFEEMGEDAGIGDRLPDPTAGVLLKMEVENALAKLSEEIRETAILFFFQELKQREIAKILGISLSLVKYRISRAKQILSGELKEEGR